MFTLLSGFLGFFSSGLPHILDFFKQRGDQSHEREMMRLQTEREIEMAKQGFIAQQKMEEIRTEQIDMQTEVQEKEALLAHDKEIVSKASQKIIDLNASVRPVVAYIFVGELVVINIISLIWAMWTGVDFEIAMREVFSADEMAITFAIITFYYGGRAWDKIMKRVGN
jgi:hypothetical protein